MKYLLGVVVAVVAVPMYLSAQAPAPCLRCACAASAPRTPNAGAMHRCPNPSFRENPRHLTLNVCLPTFPLSLLPTLSQLPLILP